MHNNSFLIIIKRDHNLNVNYAKLNLIYLLVSINAEDAIVQYVQIVENLKKV